MRVLMLLQNNPFPQDTRVSREAFSLVAAGHEVTVIVPRSKGQSWTDEVQRVRVMRFPAPPDSQGFWGYACEYVYSTIIMYLFSLWAYVRYGFDVVHAHNPPDTLVFIAAFYKILGKRFVYDQHDLAPEMYCARFHGPRNKLVHRALVWLEQLSCRLADHIIVTNESYKAMNIERSAVAPQRVTVVRNGPDCDRLRPLPPDPTLALKENIQLVYVGVMGVQDGVDFLLRALGHLLHVLGRTDFRCLLVGDGSAMTDLENLSEELHLGKHVLFTGWLGHEQVARYLAAADICVAPEPSNPYNDRSTMIKMMEYMSVAKPIVAFDLPEHRVTAEGAAVYATPNDELDFARRIVSLMDDADRRQTMGQLGRARAESVLAWRHQQEFLLEAYGKLDVIGRRAAKCAAKTGHDTGPRTAAEYDPRERPLTTGRDSYSPEHISENV